MTGRSSLAAPLANPSNTHRRRRSADARLGSGPSRPISISSGEEEEEEVEEILAPTRLKPKMPTSQSDSVLPRPSSARTPRFQLPTTPDRARIALDREVATDPGDLQSTRSRAFDDTPIANRQKHRSFCGKKQYIYLGRLHEHQRKCPDCLRIQDQKQKGNIREDEEQLAEAQIVRAPQERSLEVAHDSDDARDTIHHDSSSGVIGKNEEKEEKHEKSAQLVHRILITEARKKLTDGEEEGNVYIFRNTKGKNKGLLKIGITKDINQRAAQHERCGLVIQWVHISVRVKAMKRAERLVKLDLQHLCKPWTCSRCHKEHTEWFKVDEQKAKDVVDGWVNWINEQDPYNKDGDLEPIWSYLMDYGRLPERQILHDDHEARWAHWTWLLSPPSPSDRERFRKQNDRGKLEDKKKQAVPQQGHNGELIALPHRQYTSGLEMALTGPITIGKDVEKVARAMVDGQKSLNVTINVNVQFERCDFRGGPSVS